MGRDIEDIIDSLPEGRRAKVNARAEKLALAMIGSAHSLADLRTFSGVTQEQLGNAMGVKQNAVSQMEKRTDIYLSTLQKVVVALGFELEVALKSPDGARIALPNFQPWNAREVFAAATTSSTAKTRAVPVKVSKRKSKAEKSVAGSLGGSARIA